MDLGQRVRRRAPDAAEARDDVEAGVGPGECVHVADPHVCLRRPVAGDRDQALGGVDPGGSGAAQGGELQRQSGPARDVEQSVAGAQPELVVQCDVLPAVRGLALRGEPDGLATPAFVDALPGAHSAATSSATTGLSTPDAESTAARAAPGWPRWARCTWER